MSEQNKPWWWPTLVDQAHFTRLREDYPENADWSDEELHEYYDLGRKYSVTWDHVGDAYEEYEQLADSFLRLVEKYGFSDDA